MQEKGVFFQKLNLSRVNHVSNICGWFKKIFEEAVRADLDFFFTERRARRFGHVTDFPELWPKLRKVFEEAFLRCKVIDLPVSPHG
jgi:hypothetical protein